MYNFSFLTDLGYTAQEIISQAPLAPRTWFKLGGPAECLLQPQNTCALPHVLKECYARNIPVFFLGDGSNVLVSDEGFAGLVISTRGLVARPFSIKPDTLEQTIPAGILVGHAATVFAKHNLAGLQDFFGMPGTVGGATFMNARCYTTEWADIFVRAQVLLPNGQLCTVEKNAADWGYKKSPFQHLGGLITSVTIRLTPGPGCNVLQQMGQQHAVDRKQKGHFLAPCAGSIFKNNADFGQPTGKIIDSLGLRGYQIGGAQVAPWHANIFINTGNATAQDVKDLIFYVQNKVKAAYGYHLEPEVVFLGSELHN